MTALNLIVSPTAESRAIEALPLPVTAHGHRSVWRGALAGALAIALGAALVPAKAADSTMTSDARTDMHTSERVMSDSWITTKVKSELLANSISDGTDVSVKTTHGVVVLSGMLASRDAVDGAKRIAANVQGVKHVDSSRLTIGTH